MLSVDYVDRHLPQPGHERQLIWLYRHLGSLPGYFAVTRATIYPCFEDG